MAKPFRFGVTMFPTMSERGAWLDAARRVEASGYSVLTVTDHFRTSGGIWSSLVAAWEAAPSLRVGTIVLNNDFWRPALLAREAVTADVLTEGHLELGVGAGWDLPDYHAIGLERDSPAERIDRLGEALQILRQVFAGEPVRFEGRHYSVDGGEPWPKPKQAPLPLLVGGGGKKILSLAARHADIVSIHRKLEVGTQASWSQETADGAGLDQRVDDRIRWVREAAGDRFDDLQLHALLLRVVITQDREATAAEIGAANGLPAAQILASPHFLVGTPEQMTQDLLARRDRWGINYWTVVGNNDFEAFAPVVQHLTGH